MFVMIPARPQPKGPPPRCGCGAEKEWSGFTWNCPDVFNEKHKRWLEEDIEKGWKAHVESLKREQYMRNHPDFDEWRAEEAMDRIDPFHGDRDEDEE